MKRAITFFAAALAVLTISSCGSEERNYPAGSRPFDSYSAPGLVTLEAEGAPLPQLEQQSESAETFGRKIIKEGTIRFETADIHKTKSLIERTVQELNGYISKDTISDYSQRIEHTLIIRVPADKFDSLLLNISESVDRFDSKNIEARDVTEEYIDVQSRIKTKKELQARYTELLKQAITIDEMLNIEREIGKLQTEIESAEGRMRYLTDRAAFSTLTVTYYLPIAATSDMPLFSFSSEFMKGITTGWEAFLWFLIGLSYLWVFIVLGGIIAAAVCLFVWRDKKKTEGS